MNNRHPYLEKLASIKTRLCLALGLLQTMPPAGVAALLRKTARLLPFNADISLKDFPHNVDDPEKRLIKFKAAFKILVQNIISSLLTIYKERTQHCHTDIELNLSMSLEYSDPAAREGDNLILILLCRGRQSVPKFSLIPTYHARKRLNVCIAIFYKLPFHP